MTKLKKCPFCGGEAQFVQHAHMTYPVIICKGCKGMLFTNAELDGDVVKTWNKRAKQ